MQRRRVRCPCGAVVPESDDHRYGNHVTVACPRCGLRQTWSAWEELGTPVPRSELGLRRDEDREGRAGDGDETG